MRFIEKNNDGGGCIMNKKFLQTATVAMGLTILSLPLSACNVGTNNNTNPQRTGIIERQNTTQYGSPLRYSNENYTRIDNTRLNDVGRTITTPVPGTIVNNSNDIRAKSLNIRNQVKSVPNVKDANVVVVGNTALVACDPNTASVDTNALRTAITQKVKTADPSITNVVVTESGDMMTSVNQMFNNMNNRSANQINQDFNTLVRQITPTVS